MTSLAPLAALALVLAVAPPAADTAATPLPARLDSTATRDLLAVAVPAIAPAVTAEPWLRATLRFDGNARHTSVTPPKVERGPEVDGALEDDVWSQAAVLEAFTQHRPVEGARDTTGTVALVLYDDHHLYVGFQVPDDPAKVQAPIVPRDQIWQGDWVGVSIDAYNDRQRSFYLCANAAGIQMDGVDQEGRDSDEAPDFQYTSRGRITPRGYQVEMAIPFRTLRFAPGENVTFGFQVMRQTQRTGTRLFWSPVSRDVNSYHAQMGTLEGLHGITPGRNVQVNPTHTTTTLGQRQDDRLRFGEPHGSFGLGVKVGLTSNLIADVAMTPDFSQVEADAGVVDINERFAIFFAEKRPFFLEGSDIFTTPVNLVYTRRIVDPLYGGKLTGKVGRTSIGILNAADRTAGNGIDGLPNEVNPYLDHDALFTIARFKQDLFKNSYVGLLLGDRTLRDQYNRGAGVDGRLSWRGKYSFEFQAAQSWSRDQDLREAISRLSPTQRDSVPAGLRALTGAEREGNVWSAELSRETRGLGAEIEVESFSPDFAADMGFIERTNQLNFEAVVQPHVWAKPNQWFNAWHFPVTYQRIYTHGGDQLTDEAISLVQEADLPRNSWIGMENVRRFIRHEGVEFRDMYRHAFWIGSERFRTVRGGLTYVWGDQVVFDEAVPGRDRRIEVWSDFRFGPQFDGSLLVRGSTVWRDVNHSRFAEGLIPRLRLSYQFTKELSLRWITELRMRRDYDTNDRLVGKSQTLAPDVLLSYYVRPGTVVYLGYGSLLAGREMDDLHPQRSSVFTKLSYLWQR